MFITRTSYHDVKPDSNLFITDRPEAVILMWFAVSVGHRASILRKRTHHNSSLVHKFFLCVRIEIYSIALSVICCIICICKNKAADQLCGYSTTDQRLCFRYMDSTTRLLPKSEISSPWLSSVVV